MANREHVGIVKQGREAIRQWRDQHADEKLDLSGANLIGAHLPRADLSAADLSAADLRDADLRDASLSGADLSGAMLIAADLIAADLSGADLSGADLSFASLRAADLSGAMLIGAKLHDADLGGAHLIGAHLMRANLRGADLSAADLSAADLSAADLSAADLFRANLNGADLSAAKLIGAKLIAANLHDANLQQIITVTADGRRPADFSRANLTDASLPSAIQYDGDVGPSFLDLATAKGLEPGCFSNPQVFESYISEAFAYVHQEDIPEAKEMPNFVSIALDRIKALRKVFDDSSPPDVLVQVVKEITAELFKYLKTHPKALYDIKPRQFEELIAEILAHYGWEVRLTPASKDGGYDLFAITKDVSGVESAWIIECKKYAPHRKIGVDIVRSLFGVKMDLKVANAMLATTSHFTKGVHDYKASRYDLELRDYEGVLEWINEYKPNPDGKLHIRDNKLILPGEE